MYTKETRQLDAPSRRDRIQRAITSNTAYVLGIALIVIALITVLAAEGIRQAQAMIPPPLIATAQPTPVTALRMTLAETIIVYDAPNGAVIGPMPSGRTYDVISTDGVWTQIFGDSTTRSVWARTADITPVQSDQVQIVNHSLPTATATTVPSAIPTAVPVAPPVPAAPVVNAAPPVQPTADLGAVLLQGALMGGAVGTNGESGE